MHGPPNRSTTRPAVPVSDAFQSLHQRRSCAQRNPKNAVADGHPGRDSGLRVSTPPLPASSPFCDLLYCMVRIPPLPSYAGPLMNLENSILQKIIQMHAFIEESSTVPLNKPCSRTLRYLQSGNEARFWLSDPTYHSTDSRGRVKQRWHIEMDRRQT